MSMVAVVCAVIMLVGLFGIVIPILPGLWVVWLGVLVWSIAETSAAGWGVLAASTVLAVSGSVLQFLVPGQRMRQVGVRTTTLIIALAGAIVLGVLIPVVGALVGFPLGIYVVQRSRRHDHRAAWASTIHALKAVGLNIVIELCTALAIVVVWVVALVWWT